MAGGHVVSLSNLTTLRDNNTACLSHSVCCQTSSSWCSLIPGHAEPSSISESVKATHIATGLRSGTSGVHNELSNLCVHASIVQTAVLEPCEVLRMRTASVCMTLKPVLRVLAVLKKKKEKDLMCRFTEKSNSTFSCKNFSQIFQFQKSQLIIPDWVLIGSHYR